MAKKEVLITGMSGHIGSALKERLADKYELSALNRSDVPGVKSYRADITDLEAIKPAFEGKDAVVHLAGSGGDWETVYNLNVKGSYNVFEAARLAGVKRVIAASTGRVTGNLDEEFPYNAIAKGQYELVPPTWDMITHESTIRPDSLYACSKVWAESLGRHYSENYDMSMIFIRIGAVPHDGDSVTMNRGPEIYIRRFSTWCSLRDIAQLVSRCIDAPDSVRYDIFYGVSNNKWRTRDIEHARLVVGYEPQDNAEVFRIA